MFGFVLFCQIRDITTNPEWENAYQYEIPVLAKVHDDGHVVLALMKSCVKFGL